MALFRRHAALIALLGVIALVYAPMFWAQQSWEDTTLAELSASSPDLQWWMLLSDRYLCTKSLIWTVHAGGGVRALHATNILLHLGNCTLLYVWARRVGLAAIAVPMVLLFGLHPIQSEAVSSLGYRSELFGALGLLVALLALTYHTRVKWLWVLGGTLFTISAKSADIMAPAMVFVMWVKMRTFTRPVTRRAQVIALTLGVVAIAAAAYRLGPALQAAINWDFPPMLGPIGYASMQSCLTLRFARLLILPVGQMASANCELVWPPATVAALLVILLAAGYGAYRFVRTTTPTWFAVSGVCITLWWLPRWVMRSREFIAEHHTYVPMIFVSLVAALVWHRFTVTRPGVPA